jgi:dienelactone hydrolase
VVRTDTVHPRRTRVASVLLVTLLAAACGGGPAPISTPPTVGAPTPSTAPTPTPSPTPVPIAVLDPSMDATELFNDQTPPDSLHLTQRSRETRGEAVLHDVRFTGADGRDIAAYVVTPATGSPQAGVLFLHWLGDDFSSRDEFVAEAVKLAASGVQSMLISQHFPWSEQPVDPEHDRVAIGLQVRTIRRALTLLAADDMTRLAMVGHDYGAMYAILMASVDTRVDALVGMTPDATWANWFVTYFHVADGDAYAQAMADLDPATRISDVTAPILLQFGTTDTFVSTDAIQALTSASPGGTSVNRYDTGHRLDDRARADRDAWLLERLGVAPAPS